VARRPDSSEQLPPVLPELVVNVEGASVRTVVGSLQTTFIVTRLSLVPHAPNWLALLDIVKSACRERGGICIRAAAAAAELVRVWRRDSSHQCVAFEWFASQWCAVHRHRQRIWSRQPGVERTCQRSVGVGTSAGTAIERRRVSASLDSVVFIVERQREQLHGRDGRFVPLARGCWSCCARRERRSRLRRRSSLPSTRRATCCACASPRRSLPRSTTCSRRSAPRPVPTLTFRCRSCLTNRLKRSGCSARRCSKRLCAPRLHASGAAAHSSSSSSSRAATRCADRHGRLDRAQCQRDRRRADDMRGSMLLVESGGERRRSERGACAVRGRRGDALDRVDCDARRRSNSGGEPGAEPSQAPTVTGRSWSLPVDEAFAHTPLALSLQLSRFGVSVVLAGEPNAAAAAAVSTGREHVRRARAASARAVDSLRAVSARRVGASRRWRSGEGGQAASGALLRPVHASHARLGALRPV
jgi:hypothetical protein